MDVIEREGEGAETKFWVYGVRGCPTLSAHCAILKVWVAGLRSEGIFFSLLPKSAWSCGTRNAVSLCLFHQ